MSRKKKRGWNTSACAIPLADWLPAESSPSKYYKDLVFSDSEGGAGPLAIVGRELQLVWYKTERNRERKRKGKLVCVLEFHDCRKSRDHRGDRYCFTTLLLEDVSGEYREWIDRQRHHGRPFGAETDVLETEIQFSVAVYEPTDWQVATDATVVQPFQLHKPDVEDLSSPQVDMLFDVMSFLYQRIPAMQRMEALWMQRDAELAATSEMSS